MLLSDLEFLPDHMVPKGPMDFQTIHEMLRTDEFLQLAYDEGVFLFTPANFRKFVWANQKIGWRTKGILIYQAFVVLMLRMYTVVYP